MKCNNNNTQKQDHSIEAGLDYNDTESYLASDEDAVSADSHLSEDVMNNQQPKKCGCKDHKHTEVKADDIPEGFTLRDADPSSEQYLAPDHDGQPVPQHATKLKAPSGQEINNQAMNYTKGVIFGKEGSSDDNADALDAFAKGKEKSVKGLTSSFCSSKDCAEDGEVWKSEAAQTGNEADDVNAQGDTNITDETLIGVEQEGINPDTRFNQNQWEKSQDNNGNDDDTVLVDEATDAAQAQVDASHVTVGEVLEEAIISGNQPSAADQIGNHARGVDESNLNSDTFISNKQ